MSGIVGHTMYAILAQRHLRQHGASLADLLQRNRDVYLNAAYLGCDIQTLPEAICVDTGKEVGYGTVPLSASPLTGGPVRPWTLKFAGSELTPRDIHRRFYGRTHLLFGWSPAEKQLSVPWDHLPDYVSLVARDGLQRGPNREAVIAWITGWLVHIVSDSLIKSIQPGLSMKLLDGLYTPANRPIQDLYTWHRVGLAELQLDWTSLLQDLCNAPVLDVQLHAMRVARPSGYLPQDFPDGWNPADEPLARRVCTENRRYLKLYLQQLLPRYQLHEQDGVLQCTAELSRIANGMSWTEMQQEAIKSGMRDTLEQIATQTVHLIRETYRRVPSLAGSTG
ncbi:MAG: hypothetical protein ACPGXX_03100 [Planctomycetaceae bacterium]